MGDFVILMGVESKTKVHLCTPYWLAKVTWATILLDTWMALLYCDQCAGTANRGKTNWAQ